MNGASVVGMGGTNGVGDDGMVEVGVDDGLYGACTDLNDMGADLGDAGMVEMGEGLDGTCADLDEMGADLDNAGGMVEMGDGFGWSMY